MQNQNNPQAPIAIYQTADGVISTEVRLEGETVWLTQAQMAELYQVSGKTISTVVPWPGWLWIEMPPPDCLTKP